MFYNWEKVEREQVLTVLRSLKALFSDPLNWIYWPTAVDSNDLPVEPTNDQAIKWSLMGATDMLSHLHYDKSIAQFIDCAAREYLNDISDDELIHGRLSYLEEISLIDLGIEDLTNEINQ